LKRLNKMKRERHPSIKKRSSSLKKWTKQTNNQIKSN
jgi:hypothetical protein